MDVSFISFNKEDLTNKASPEVMAIINHNTLLLLQILGEGVKNEKDSNRLFTQAVRSSSFREFLDSFFEVVVRFDDTLNDVSAILFNIFRHYATKIAPLGEGGMSLLMATAPSASLSFISGKRLFQICMLYHEPGNVSPETACFHLFKSVLKGGRGTIEKELCREFEMLSSRKTLHENSVLVGVRNVLELLTVLTKQQENPDDERLLTSLFNSLGGIRATNVQAIQNISVWYGTSCFTPYGKGHLICVLKIGLVDCKPKASLSSELNLCDLILHEDGIIEKSLLSVLVFCYREELVVALRLLHNVEEERIDFCVEYLNSLLPTRIDQEVELNEGKLCKFVNPPKVQQDNNNNNNANQVLYILELFPNLEEKFIVRLLSHFENNVETVIERIVEENYPPQVLTDLLFEQNGSAPPPNSTTEGKKSDNEHLHPFPHVVLKKDDFREEETLPELSNDLKSKLMRYYDAYEDEVDSRFDDGVVFALDKGSFEDAEESGIVMTQSRRVRAEVDADGQLRDANGKVVVLDPIMRPNMNKAKGVAPSSSSGVVEEDEAEKPNVTTNNGYFTYWYNGRSD